MCLTFWVSPLGKPGFMYSHCFLSFNDEKEMEEEAPFPVRNTEIFLQLPSFLMLKL